MFNKTKQELIDFEKIIFNLFEAGDLPYVIHLCGGNEDPLIEIFKDIQPGDYVFSTHRTHYHYLLSGGKDEDLINKIKSGDSMFVFDRKLNFFSSSILAGCAGIAAGVALGLKLAKSDKKVWCFIGDGAEDEGHFYEAVMFVEGHDLPCTFIVEDNDRSVETSIKGRRGKNFSINWPGCVKRYFYTPTYPHISTGTGNMIKFNPEVVNAYLNSK